VGSVGITQNSSGKDMGFVPRERKRPQIIKNQFFLGDPQGEHNSPWRVQYLG
jgi:hypothetical protein